MNHFSTTCPFQCVKDSTRTSFQDDPPVIPCCKVVLVFKLHQCALLFNFLDLGFPNGGLSESVEAHRV